MNAPDIPPSSRAGIVQIRQMTPAGDGILLGLFRVGEVVGRSAALEGDMFPADAIALGGTVDVVSIRAEALREALAESMALGPGGQPSAVEAGMIQAQMAEEEQPGLPALTMARRKGARAARRCESP